MNQKNMQRRTVCTAQKWNAYILGIALFSFTLVFGFAQEKSTTPAGTLKLRLATTTSVENSGLLSYLLPQFTAYSGYKVDVIAVGTGAALNLAKNGDVDAVLVHAPDLEVTFCKEGYGIDRRTFMVNDFLIVGPRNDPAKVAQATSILEAFSRIAREKALFLSRGDNSGTHVKELEIWKKAALNPQGAWYKEVGQGMEAVLWMADNLQAYTLTDSATWAFIKQKTNLAALYRNMSEPILQNIYSVIAVNPARHPHSNYTGATLFIQWICSPEGLKAIESYRIGDEQLFFLYPGSR